MNEQADQSPATVKADATLRTHTFGLDHFAVPKLDEYGRVASRHQNLSGQPPVQRGNPGGTSAASGLILALALDRLVPGYAKRL